MWTFAKCLPVAELILKIRKFSNFFAIINFSSATRGQFSNGSILLAYTDNLVNKMMFNYFMEKKIFKNRFENPCSLTIPGT